MRVEGIFGKYYGVFKVTKIKDSNQFLVCSAFKHVLEWANAVTVGQFPTTLKEDSAYPFRSVVGSEALGLLLNMVGQTCVTYDSFSKAATAALPPELVEAKKKFEENLKKMMSVVEGSDVPGTEFKN
jgi:hypothetical protein